MNQILSWAMLLCQLGLVLTALFKVNKKDILLNNQVGMSSAIMFYVGQEMSVVKTPRCVLKYCHFDAQHVF